MTIAVCYVSRDGVVFAADSLRTTMEKDDAGTLKSVPIQYPHEQKILEIGANSSLALMTSGIADFGDLSIRTLAARLADDLAKQPADSVLAVARRFGEIAFEPFTTSPVWGAKFKLPPLRLCVGGWCGPDRVPKAAIVEFVPGMTSAPDPIALAPGIHVFEQERFARRILDGIDPFLQDHILDSAHWTGSEYDFASLLSTSKVRAKIENIPLRDAIDLAHLLVHVTIRLERYTGDLVWCGGPIELAVITSDRPFRWIRHKALDAALGPDLDETLGEKG